MPLKYLMLLGNMLQKHQSMSDVHKSTSTAKIPIYSSQPRPQRSLNLTNIGVILSMCPAFLEEAVRLW